MSCDRLHDADAPRWPHASEGTPGDTPPAGDAAAGDQAQDAAPAETGPSAARQWWGKHGHLVRPYGLALGADGYATAAHFMAPGAFQAVLAGLAAGITAEVVTEVTGHRGKRSKAARARTRKSVAVATSWMMLASGWTPTGWHDIIQWLALVGGVVIPSHNLYANRRDAQRDPGPTAGDSEEDEGPRAIAAPRPVDPRLTAFREQFCGPDCRLDGAAVDHFTVLPRGFSLQLGFPRDSRLNISDVEAEIVQIAKLYDVTRDRVTIGYLPGGESENRCQVVVQTVPVLATAERANPKWNRWDGKTTYDPATGMVGLGLFHDQGTAHYLLHTPYSGAAMGMVAGTPGSGKSGTINVIAADAGQAMMCVHCGPRGDCGQCDLQRMVALWMGDAQAQGLSVWRGYADLTGWGPEGCVELLQLADTTARARSQVLSSLEWQDTGPDGRPRRNVGKGWFDPWPGFPLILLVLDELPELAIHPDRELATEALSVLVKGVTQWRKVGIHPLVGTQMLDVGFMGDRAVREMIKFFNVIAHRCDEASSDMGGIVGDPTKLPLGEAGAGYTNGPERRPKDRFDTKFMPETLRPGMTGMDIRHLAAVIGRTRIDYDPGTLQAMDLHGITHQQVITEWNGRAPGDDVPPAPAGMGPGIGGLPTRDEAQSVLCALRENPAADLYRLMEVTGLDMAAAGRALDLLAANGDAIRTGEDQYTAA